MIKPHAAEGIMTCTHIVSDASGGSRFETHELAMSARVPAIGVPAIATSADWPGSSVSFMHVPPADSGRALPWHPAPGPRLIICLSGTSQQETTDGDVRTFAAGDFFLTLDVAGKGHRSTNFGETTYAIVVLDRDPTTQSAAK